MLIPKSEQRALLDRAMEDLEYIRTYVCGELPNGAASFNRALDTLRKLRISMRDPNTYIKLVDRDGEATFRYFDEDNIYELCRYAAQLYCFSDYDDEYSIKEIKYNGKLLEYVGWQPCMLFEFREVETGTLVYSQAFPHWEH